MSILDRAQQMFVNGKWQASNGAEMQAVDPSTGESFVTLRGASAEDVQQAAEASAAAFVTWGKTPSTLRAQYLRGFAKGLQDRAPELIDLLMRNNGKPKFEAEICLGDAVASFEYYATLADELDAKQDQQVHHAGGEHRGYVRHEPLGPVGMIVPWNFPLMTAAWKIAPALAAGCTVVLKTSEITPLTEFVLAEIAQDIDLPAGVLNILTGGAEAGIAMSAAPQFRKISFTGSNMTGGKVMSAVSDRCLPVALELGGKSPIIVTADADIAQAVELVSMGIFFNAGQACSATSRLIVDKSIEGDLIDALAAAAKGLNVGSPYNEASEMGPITSAQQFQKVKQYLAGARDDGLDCVAGGNARDNEPGFFVEPTIFRNVPHNNTIWREEVFGPVLATTTVSSEAEAIAVANDTHYGLVGAVVSREWDDGKRIADQLVAGQIFVNSPQVVYPDSAWGGFKSSGIGRELGPWGLSGYQGVKHILSPVAA
ncbi:aldehyde dehydrogenase family protein [Ruegeria halocynthiae]|uniref:aldehyde dehydrogenase family protein n=1 Tax=Ruegeria halocynthiae TaxID=985054 RepID=UPI00069210A2|nr:aldehyde dehydrogenase family protein [Ruegeria halocynthiae]